MNPQRDILPIYGPNRYGDIWDEHHVRMPCSPLYTSVSQKKDYLFTESFLKRNGQPRWSIICQYLLQLKRKCDNRTATVEDLKVIN
jgi:hypothetical protein